MSADGPMLVSTKAGDGSAERPIGVLVNDVMERAARLSGAFTCLLDTVRGRLYHAERSINFALDPLGQLAKTIG